MTAIHILPILAAIVITVRFPNSASAQSAPEKPKDAREQELDALIDALATSNPRPEIFGRGPERFALFDEKYDWAEQRRAIEAFRALIEAEGDELWPRLVEHSDDERYALTYNVDDRASNATVGSLCRNLAVADLLYPYRRHSPTMTGVSRQSQYWELWTPERNLYSELKSWYRKHERKPLHELQIELCEWAIEKAPALGELPENFKLERVRPLTDGQKQKFKDDVREEIAKIKETGKPIVGTHKPQARLLDGYNADDARTMRYRYKKDKGAQGAKATK
jgi:hypothetical protein